MVSWLYAIPFLARKSVSFSFSSESTCTHGAAEGAIEGMQTKRIRKGCFRNATRSSALPPVALIRLRHSNIFGAPNSESHRSPTGKIYKSAAPLSSNLGRSQYPQLQVMGVRFYFQPVEWNSMHGCCRFAAQTGVRRRNDRPPFFLFRVVFVVLFS